MFVKLNIEVPVKLSSEEKDLLQKLDKIMGNKASSNPKSESFFRKVGDFFK